MQQVKIRIEGITPLLFNRFIEAQINTPTKKRPGATKQVDVEDKLYRNNGKIYTPASHLEGALINAGKNFKIQGKQRATYSKLLGSAIDVTPEAIIHEKQKWEIDERSGVNPNTKGRVWICRPIMREWSLNFNVVFNGDDIPKEVLKNILDYAGQYVGIGDYRPDKKGKFGKFIVTAFK